MLTLNRGDAAQVLARKEGENGRIRFDSKKKGPEYAEEKGT